MSFTFAPPVRSEIPPTLPEGHPGNRLMRFFRARPAGVNVYLYRAGSLSAAYHGRVDENDPIALYDSDGVATTNGWEDLELVFWGGCEAVVITTAQAQALQAAGYTVVELAPPEPTPPIVSSLSPSTGTAGTLVAILGTNLAEVTAVYIDATPVSFTIVGSTLIRFTFPSSADDVYDITVENVYGTSDAVTFTYTTPVEGADPVISNVSPSSGPTGTVVTLTGTSFTGTTSVVFGAVSATFNVDSSTSITTTAPAQADGPVNVVVTTPDGTSNAVTFTYTTAGPSDPHPGSDLLLEDGSFLLLEDGTSTLLLES